MAATLSPAAPANRSYRDVPRDVPVTPARRPMGFCAVYDRPAASRPYEAPSDGDLLRFDSGRSLSFAQGLRNVLVLGQTGSGKTTSAIMPMIRSLIAAGFGGLVLDVKGSLRGHVRAIARACGRLGDVVEFGSDPSANKTNLFAGLAVHEWVALLETITMDGLRDASSAAWFIKGAKMAGEVGRILYGLSRIARRSEFSKSLRPTLRLIHACLTDRKLAAGLLLLARAEFEALAQGRDVETLPAFMMQAERLFAEIDADRFHVMKRRAKFSEEDERQLVWMTQRILFRLSQLQATRGLLDRFSCTGPEAVPMDLGRLVHEEGKIVLLHFGMDCGPAGDLLCRTVKGMYYQAVMSRGLELPKDRYTFLVADEFQHLLNVDHESRLNDMDFFGLSREFRNINVIASQSVASLRAKGDRDGVDSLLANCTSKLLLKSSDPRTIAWARGFREDAADMKDLRRGGCLLEGMDDNDDTISCKDGLNGAYAYAREGVEPEPEKPSRRERAASATPSGLPYAMEKKLRELGTVVEERAVRRSCFMTRQEMQEDRDRKLIAELRKMRAETNPDRRHGNQKRREAAEMPKMSA